MPLMHECNQLGCHRLVPAGHKFCDEHYKQHQQDWTKSRARSDKLIADRIYNHQRRDEEANAFYHSQQWTRTRDHVKSRDMMISGLSNKPLSDHDYIVDHIVPRRLSKNPYDMNNLWLLSRAEHNRKTKYEEKLPDQVLVELTADDWRHKLNINRK